MTVAFNPDTTANSIASVTVSGVTVLDIDQIPQGAQLITPVLFPQPEAWLSDVVMGTKRIDLNDAEGSDFTYSLHYVFLHSPLGSGISQTSPYNDMIAKLKTIIQTILGDDTLNGSVNISLGALGGIGAVEDPSGNAYWGALLSFNIAEYA